MYKSCGWLVYIKYIVEIFIVFKDVINDEEKYNCYCYFGCCFVIEGRFSYRGGCF